MGVRVELREEIPKEFVATVTTCGLNLLGTGNRANMYTTFHYGPSIETAALDAAKYMQAHIVYHGKYNVPLCDITSTPPREDTGGCACCNLT